GDHGQEDDRRRQQGGHDHSPAQRPHGVVGRPAVGLPGGPGRRGSVGRGSGEPGPVAGGLHLGDELVGRDAGGHVDRRLLRGEVDGGRDALDPVEALLDAGGAGRAGHALDLELDAAGRGGGRGGHGWSSRWSSAGGGGSPEPPGSVTVRSAWAATTVPSAPGIWASTRWAPGARGGSSTT